jgi:hypothetical protein
MDAFPFTNSDWNRVQDAICPIVNATLANDDAVADSLFIGLQETLHELRCKYGDHPILLETEADFCRDPDESIRLYSNALNIAKAFSLPTDSICLSYASALIDNERNLNEALTLLQLCREQVYANADKTDMAQHEELMSLLATHNSNVMR